MLGVTDFLVKGQLDATLLERSIRYAIRHHAVLARAAREPGALRARRPGRQRRHLGLGPASTSTIYFAPRWKAMLGYADDEVGDRPDEWLDRVHPDDLERLRARDRRPPRRAAPRTSRASTGSATPTAASAGCSAAGSRCATATARPTRMAGSMSDITDRKAAEEQLRHDALHDSLTGLPNRTLFLDRLELSLRRAKRDRDYRCAVLFLDLDRFKLVNDGFSHAVGDQLLVALAQRLTRDAAPRRHRRPPRRRRVHVLLDGIDSTRPRVEVAERIQATARASRSSIDGPAT